MLFRLGRAKLFELLTCFHILSKMIIGVTKTILSEMSRYQYLIALIQRGSMCRHQKTHRVLEGQQDYSTVLALCVICIATNMLSTYIVYTENTTSVMYRFRWVEPSYYFMYVS